MSTVTLVSSDVRQFVVDVEIARMSKTVRRLMEDLGSEENDVFYENNLIPIPHVTADCLRRIVEWCTKHSDKASSTAPDARSRATYKMSNAEERFFKVPNTTLFELIEAANYLGISGLLEASCHVVANMFKERSPDAIRTIFGIKNDLTHRAMKRIEQETSWIEYPRTDDTTPNYSEDIPQEYSEYIQPSPFPLMELSDEILTIILQHMNLADRLIARVNERLYMLESSGHFWSERLTLVIGHDYADYASKFLSNSFCDVILRGASSLRILRKFVSNVSVGSLQLFILCDGITYGERDSDNAPDVERTIANPAQFTTCIPYIKRISAKELRLRALEYFTEVDDTSLEEWFHYTHHLDVQLQEFSDSSLLDWANGRDSMDLSAYYTAITGAGLFQLYQAMFSRESSLRRLYLHVTSETCLDLLHHVGILLSNDIFSTNRTDVQIFVDGPRFPDDPMFPDMSNSDIEDTEYAIFIGDCMLISAHRRLIHYEGSSELRLERHNDDDSLPNEPWFKLTWWIRGILGNPDVYKPIPIAKL